LHLALRILDAPGGDGGPMTLEALLDDPEVRRWAGMQVTPLLKRDPELSMKTLRVWLDNDARLDATASALGISVPGTRKRLTRIEEILGRSLLSGPSARYELWFALRVHDASSEPA
jgi:sugar diacid utilization regulator